MPQFDLFLFLIASIMRLQLHVYPRLLTSNTGIYRYTGIIQYRRLIHTHVNTEVNSFINKPLKTKITLLNEIQTVKSQCSAGAHDHPTQSISFIQTSCTLSSHPLTSGTASLSFNKSVTHVNRSNLLFHFAARSMLNGNDPNCTNLSTNCLFSLHVSLALMIPLLSFYKPIYFYI